MMNIRILTLSILALSTLAVSACNTISGIGRDIESAGEAVQGAAD